MKIDHRIAIIATFIAMPAIAIDPVTMAAIASVLPDNLAINLSAGADIYKSDSKCFGDVNNEVLNDGGTMTIVFGKCPASFAGASALGKAGDIIIIPLKQLKLIRNFGTVSAPEIEAFTSPSTTISGWDNAIYFTFKPLSPIAGRQFERGSHRKIPLEKTLQGREAQIVMRSRTLTPELAQAEGYSYNPESNQILLEIWGRTHPSITGSKQFKQIFNIAFDAAQVGKKAFAIAVDQTGNVALSYKMRDLNTNEVRLHSHQFNVGKETP